METENEMNERIVGGNRKLTQKGIPQGSFAYCDVMIIKRWVVYWSITYLLDFSSPTIRIKRLSFSGLVST